MLDDRKKSILRAVISEYIKTGEPVGSKTIAADGDLKVSAATIRNDMAVLEQLGYLEQPHTSAGRIPTFSAYQLYIEEFMPQIELTEQDKAMLDEYLDDTEPTAENLLGNAATALSELTRCAVISSNLSPKFSVISKVEVIPTGRRMYAVLLITSNGSIKNKVCRLQFDLSHEQLDFFRNYMAENLQGISIEDLSEEVFDRILSATSGYMLAMAPLLTEIKNLADEFSDSNITINNEQSLLLRQDIDSAALTEFIKHKELVSKLLDESFGDLTVAFGGDSNFTVSNTGLVVGKIKKSGKNAGALGVLGPLRIDYAKIIPYIEYLTGRITEILSENETDDEIHIE
ncbi:MAG: heat-inducible transcriptional repressor HrcA [Ruminococcus sp.]|jgi:heat-inducible transcriptional repressor|nr:heat-inducible transcriptional repressor HrcA [Ruminococcus sp.]